MRINKSAVAAVLSAATLFAAGAVHAGPPVTVTFKNLNTTTPASYTRVTSNENSTYVNASPKPVASVTAGVSDSYVVTYLTSPDVGGAYVRYTMGGKTCVFGTTFLNEIIPGGIFNPGGTPNKVPKWTKTATPSGGAVCTATITSQNLTTYAWSVEFTMK